MSDDMPLFDLSQLNFEEFVPSGEMAIFRQLRRGLALCVTVEFAAAWERY